MLQGQVNLKRGLAFFLFGFFKFYHFYKEKLFYFLQNCVIHLKTNFFFTPKTEPVCMCKEGWCVE